MALSSTSNTINALGIFGRLKPEQEKYFAKLESKFSKRPKNSDANGIFNHLSLVINNDVPVGEMPNYLDLLRELKPYLPFKIKTSGVTVKDEKHLALSFDLKQTEKIRKLASHFFSKGVIATYYTKVVWFVSKENQEKAMKELEKVKKMVFFDFILVANRQNNQNTIYSSKRYL
ncbi:MAG: hypothetical protein ABIB61_00415 [Candidatus Shapirobacteria bacterium]